jgi:UDP-N-acetylglucosamine--dolichyl-phosphate N-acetylglucosaminephosphotransferase
MIFLYSVFATYVAMPYVILKLKKFGYMVCDQHKIDKQRVPSMGGIAIFAGVLVSLSLSQLLINNKTVSNLFVFYFVVIIYALYGLLDDLFHFKVRYNKIPVLLVLSLPIASLINNSNLNLFGNLINLNGLYTFLIIPMYIMIVANLVNIHAGFNGLGPGTALIVLIAAGIKSYMLYGLSNLSYLMPILGGAIVFMFYNWYPAKVFDGNIGAFLMGSALGCFLVINQIEIFGIICLLPNIITFVLDTWVLGIKKIPDQEFPKLRKDGLIIPDASMKFKSFKNLICTLFPLTEKKATILSLMVTVICCVVAVMVL